MAPESPKFRRLFKLVQKLAEEIHSVAERIVVPLVGYDDDRFCTIGTGTLFAVAEKTFLVTARHVLTDNLKLGFKLGVWNGIEGTRPRQIGAQAYWPNDKRADVAIFDLENETMEYVRASKDVIRAGSLPRGIDGFPDGFYFAYGYPMEEVIRSEDGKRAAFTPLRICTNLYHGPTPFQDYDPKIHLLFCAEQGAAVGESGQPKKRPTDLGGISGGPVFLVKSLDGSAHGWSASNPCWAGIISGVYRGGDVLQATRTEALFTLIAAQYPGFDRAMQVIEA